MSAMRPIEERHVAIKIDIMIWSTKMDLLALSYANGEVALHRLNWLKVWVLPSRGGGLTAKGIAWRPDGKVIAIGYSNRELILVDVESKEIISKSDMEGDISCVKWSDDRGAGSEQQQQQQQQQPTAPTHPHTPSSTSHPHHVFLPKLPSLRRGTAEEHANDAKGIEDLKDQNILLVGLSTGQLLLIIFGLYPRITVDIKAMLNLSECTILDAGISKKQDVLLVTVVSGSAVWVAVLDTPLLCVHDKDMMTLACKYGHVTTCLEYMDLTLQNIIEGWENIMMEMDSKLKTYASKVQQGQLCSDFLELLMFGTASMQMSEFLLYDLTEKGLKKLNHSVDLSYLNIQGLVLKHLQAVGQSLSFHLDELCGLARCPSFSYIMGLPEADAMAAFAATGSFLVKVAEVQHVIDESLKKNKAFFRWLYATYLRLCDEHVTPEVGNMSELQLQHIVDFISGLEDDGKFNLEQLGQYLADAPLEAPPPPAEAWGKLLEKNRALANLPQIVPHNPRMSLVQEARSLRHLATHVFDRAEGRIVQHFQIKHFTNISLSPSLTVLPKVTHSFLSAQEKLLVAVVDPGRDGGYNFLEISSAENAPCHSFIDSPHKVVDIQFYLPDVLSLLLDLSPASDAGFAQVQYAQIGEGCCVRTIQGMAPAQFAVSGSRKVAVVLSDSRRKIKIFEMDVEEEDDEEGMDTTSSSVRDHDLDSSKT